MSREVFWPGDTVRLRTGSPDMIVEEVVFYNEYKGKLGSIGPHSDPSVEIDSGQEWYDHEDQIQCRDLGVVWCDRGGRIRRAILGEELVIAIVSTEQIKRKLEDAKAHQNP